MEDFQVARKYQAISLIGRGGMGAVYDAVHRTTGRRVALKLLREDQLTQTRAIERFLREARIVGGLSSPHVAGALDAGTDEDSGIPYLAMEFLEGCDLKSLLSRRRRLPCGLALVIALQVCRGLAAAHAAGIIHRDVKPANVRLTGGADGELVVKVMDFGVAKDVSEEISLTATGDMVGSLSHMAPEQFSASRKVDFRADVWGVGMLLYESIAGVLPASPPVSFGLLAVSNPSAASAANLRKRYPEVPAAVADLVARALSASPDDRFGSAGEMEAAISGLLVPGARVAYSDIETSGDVVLRAEATQARSYATGSWLGDQRQAKKWWLAISVLAAMIVVVAGIGVARGLHHEDAPAAHLERVAPEPRVTPEPRVDTPAPAPSATESLAPLSQPTPAPPPPETASAPSPRPMVRPMPKGNSSSSRRDRM